MYYRRRWKLGEIRLGLPVGGYAEDYLREPKRLQSSRRSWRCRRDRLEKVAPLVEILIWALYSVQRSNTYAPLERG